MEISLRDIKRVRIHDFVYTLKHWRTAFTVFEKLAIAILLVLVLGTSFRWAMAATSSSDNQPATGGTFIEGIVGDDLASFDLGRLTKVGLVRFDEKDNILPDLATKWTISDDKTDYKFTTVSDVSSYVVCDILKKNPSYLPAGVMPSAIEPNVVQFKLATPDSEFLRDLSVPLFPYGPYKVSRITDNEIRLVLNQSYHLQRPYFDRFVIRKFETQQDLEKAAKGGNITGSIDLDSAVSGWQSKTITLNRKHILFVNSSKSYLKSTKVRSQILSGEKPDSIDTLDVLEVNGLTVDPEYAALKDKLTKAGVKINARRVSLKDALVSDLPKRNYDLLYILINEGTGFDPYLFWNSENRSETGQNFAELANAVIDNLTDEYRNTDDPNRRKELLDKINSEVDTEKVAIQYKNIQETYTVAPAVKGFFLPANLSSGVDRFNFVGSWYLKQRLF